MAYHVEFLKAHFQTTKWSICTPQKSLTHNYSKLQKVKLRKVNITVQGHFSSNSKPL